MHHIANLRRSGVDRNTTRILVLGRQQCGKSSLVEKYFSLQGAKYTAPTNEREILEGNTTKVVTVDVTFIEPPASNTQLITNCIKEADGFLLVYDVTNQKSFDDLEQYKLMLFGQLRMSHIPLVIVGTKTDLSILKEVSTDELKDIACEFMIDRGVPAFELDTEDSDHIFTIFAELVGQIAIGKVNSPEKKRHSRSSLKASMSHMSDLLDIDLGNEKRKSIKAFNRLSQIFKRGK
jgi:small GTP-binding protein